LYRSARTIHGRIAIAILCATALAAGHLAAAPSPAAAATFLVGGCSYSQLIADIEAANDESSYPGGDTINLQGSCTFILSPAYGSTVFALPTITTDVIIDGHGARIELASDAEARSIFNVANGGSLLLANVTLAEAVGQNSTGASVHNRGATTLSHVTLTHTVPYGQGGTGIYNDDPGVLAILSSRIEGQLCVLCGASAIRNRGSLTMTDSIVSANAGSAAFVNIGTAAVYGSTFTSNVDAAIRNFGGLEVHDSSFVDNQALASGAAINNTGAADLSVDGSYFENNEVSGEGGAIYNGAESIAHVINSTFYDNTATSRFFPCCVAGTGGAISNHHSLTVEHATFARNGAGDGSSVASPEGIAAIEASAFGSARSGAHCSGTILDNGSNVNPSSDASCPSTFIDGDAQLSLPAVHGSGTKTLALGAGSAAFDAVPTAGCPAYDQRGVARPVGARCDAGAFEDQRPSAPGAPGLTTETSPNQGTFVLDWTAAADPDGTPVGYRLYRHDADESHFSEISTPQSAYDFRSGEPEGTQTYAVLADDGNLLSTRTIASQTIVVDRTAPSAPSRGTDRSPDAGNWWRDTVTLSFFGSTDPDLPDGSPGSGVTSITAPITVTTSGVHPLSGTATDAAGNVSDETTATVRVDAESPTVGFTACPGDVILKSATALAWSASDPSSGISGATSGSVALDTATIGSRTASVVVSDLVGHQSTATCTYRVVYDFQGFFAPLGNPPKLTDIKAGTVIPVVFSLGGDQGLGVLAVGSPQSAPVSCTAPETLTSGVATVASGPLDYQKAQGGRYRYSWSTSKSWAGTCRQLIVTLTDGTVHRANVRFK
jgi:hypothetical protein